MSSNDCTYFFIFVSGKILNVVQQDWGTKKKKKKRKKKKGRIIELIITENHGCDLGKGRRGDKPYCQENLKEMKRSTMQSGSIGFSNPAIRNYQEAPSFSALLDHPFRTSPGKSHFSHLSHHIFHLGRSPIIMRPPFIFHLLLGQVTRNNEIILKKKHIIFSGYVTHYNETALHILSIWVGHPS